jgi:hypothetical protein
LHALYDGTPVKFEGIGHIVVSKVENQPYAIVGQTIQE